MPANAIDWGMTVKPIVRPAKTSPTKSRLEYSGIHCSTYSFRLVRSNRDRRHASPVSRWLYCGFRLKPDGVHSAPSTATVTTDGALRRGLSTASGWLTAMQNAGRDYDSDAYTAYTRYCNIICVCTTHVGYGVCAQCPELADPADSVLGCWPRRPSIGSRALPTHTNGCWTRRAS